MNIEAGLVLALRGSLTRRGAEQTGEEYLRPRNLQALP